MPDWLILLVAWMKNNWKAYLAARKSREALAAATDARTLKAVNERSEIEAEDRNLSDSELDDALERMRHYHRPHGDTD